MAISPVTNFFPIDASKAIEALPSKKRRLDETLPCDGLAAQEQSLTQQDLARKVFFERVCYTCISYWHIEPLTNVCIIIPWEKKIEDRNVIKNGLKLAVQVFFPGCQGWVKWIDVPKQEFFKRSRFHTIMQAVYSINMRCILFMLAGNTLIRPQYYVEKIAKNPPIASPPDQIIFFDAYDMPALKIIFKLFQERFSAIPCHYVTSVLVLKLGRITDRSLVFFFENGRLEQMKAHVLSQRGFRIIHSVSKK